MVVLLEAIDRPFRFHFVDGSEVRLAPGAPVQLDEARARRLLEKVPRKVKVVSAVSPGALMECETKCEAPLTLPEAPLRPGWVVVYRNQRGLLCGGWNERDTSAVTNCTWDGRTWTVVLKGGQRIALASVEAVGHVTTDGRLCAAWTVRAHGYDGQGDRARGHE